MYDACALGEVLIDLTENGFDDRGNADYVANVGGAPCNVLAMLARLGKATAFLGKVGGDFFGARIKEVLQELKINIDGVATDASLATTLAFVHTLSDGDRAFSFFRDHGADTAFCAAEVSEEIIKNSRIFHFGSLSMTHETCENATLKGIKIAEESGSILTFDPNLRERLWDSAERAKSKIKQGLRHCHVLKIADNELEFLTGEAEPRNGVRRLQDEYNIPLIFVTMGKKGSIAVRGQECVFMPTYSVNTIETTGAGDAFFGCVLYKITENNYDINTLDLEKTLSFSNAGAALVTTKKGALQSMPEYEDILNLMKTR